MSKKKKTAILAVLPSVTVSAFAQQSLWDLQFFETVTVNPDKSATFKIKSPGSYIWRNWRIYLNDFAQRIFK